jgi:hypothetical protein
VIAAALGMGARVYTQFLAVHRSLWYDAHHDRNAHYLFAVKLAESVKQGRVFALLRDLNAARVWPPLHGAVLAPILLVKGFDYRLAVLPSLTGWVAAVLLAFLVARRSAGRYGNLAGLVAALFLLASPAHRAFAADVMLESLGASLTLLVLYFYLTCVQDGRPWCGRALGLSLTALFFHKYNYWLLAVFALTASELSSRAGLYGRWLRRQAGSVDWGAWRRRQARAPLNYLLAGVLAYMVAVILTGTKAVTIHGRLLRLYPLHNAVTLAYALFFLRLVSWQRGSGRAWSAGLEPRFRGLLLWHAWPVAVSFLLPRRLGVFLWYLSPANFTGAKPTWNQSISFYADVARADYHLLPPLALVALALLAVGLLAAASRRLRPGGGAVVWLFLIGAYLTVSHPCLQGRYLHSWFAAGWVVGGIGLARCLQLRFLDRRPLAQASLAGAVLVGLTAWQLPAIGQAGHAPEGGARTSQASILEVTDCYLDSLPGSAPVGLFSSVPFRFLGEWTWAERYGGRGRLDCHWFGFGKPGEENRRGFERWLQTTPCETLVFVDRLPKDGPHGSPEPECVFHDELSGVLGSQATFHRVSRRDFPHHRLSVSIWRRGGEPRASASRAAQ